MRVRVRNVDASGYAERPQGEEYCWRAQYDSYKISRRVSSTSSSNCEGDRCGVGIALCVGNGPIAQVYRPLRRSTAESSWRAETILCDCFAMTIDYRRGLTTKTTSMLLKPLGVVVGSTKNARRHRRYRFSQSKRAVKRSENPHKGRTLACTVLAAGVQDPGAILGSPPRVADWRPNSRPRGWSDHN
jgi:hypothetical protein